MLLMITLCLEILNYIIWNLEELQFLLTQRESISVFFYIYPDVTKPITWHLWLLFDRTYVSIHLDVEGGENDILIGIDFMNLDFVHNIQGQYTHMLMTEQSYFPYIHLPTYTPVLWKLLKCVCSVLRSATNLPIIIWMMLIWL